MQMTCHLKNLFTGLTEIYEGEGRPGGDLAARQLRAVLEKLPKLATDKTSPLGDIFDRLVPQNSHALIREIRDLAPYLPWEYSELGGRIKPSIGREMIQVELLGPDGLITNDVVRVGIWLQSPNLDYTTRQHQAEETFFILSGSALWSVRGGEAVQKGVGSYIHHPSMTPHADKTTSEPMLAAWRWSGNVDFENYELMA